MPIRLFLILVLLLAGCASSAPAAREKSRLPDHPVAHVEELLKRYPGVRLIRRGNGFQVRIRGAHREPLYIVDGMPLMPNPDGTLMGINPYDIADIKVLTDPVDLSFYGSRGANGVVIITTKLRWRVYPVETSRFR